ncbi:MAG: ISAzo13 family transposase [Candidatus Binatia bacterium]
MESRESVIQEKYAALSPHLTERGRRIWAATEVKSYGRGGIAAVYRATGLTDKTIRRGRRELEAGAAAGGRIRKAGAGRKRLGEKDPTLASDLERLVDPVTRGDPQSPLLWTSKSTYKLCEALREQGHQISQRSVYNLLRENGYTLQSNRKSEEGASHPDRNDQFEYIYQKVQSFQAANHPVISVDAKKKENLGNFKNPGKEYHPSGKAPKVRVYDFMDKETGKAIPYGVYDLAENQGWVSVGISHDTAEFAVATIRAWWQQMGKPLYKKAKALYITADGGGSNGSRVRLWKTELQRLANELHLTIHVSHFPPGTSKWNKIEHRMFSFISKNWRGRPLLDRATVVNLIGTTQTKTGLTIQARLDDRRYEKGRKITDQEMQTVNITRDPFHGEWNYSIAPQPYVNTEAINA